MFSFSASALLNLHYGTFPDEPYLPTVSGRKLVRRDLQNSIDIEDDHQLSIQPMHACRHLRHPRIEIDRIDLSAFIRELHDLADRIDQKSVGLAAQFDTDSHR